MTNMGMIGSRYWGPNGARNFHKCPAANLVSVCEVCKKRRVAGKAAFLQLKVYSEPIDLIVSDDIQAVAIVTAVLTRYTLARATLMHGKHVFGEKPYTANA